MDGSIGNNYCNKSNINFTAKVRLSGLDDLTTRFRNIGRIYEGKTSKFPTDTMEISREYDGGLLLDYATEGLENENCCQISANQLEQLLKKSDEFIAEKFAKLTRIFKRKDKETDLAAEFASRIDRISKYENTADEFADRFWDIMLDKLCKDRDIAISKDPVLKNFTLY